MTFERRLGIKMLLAILAFGAMLALHWWQDALLEDGAWLWSCHTMGNRECAHGQPWIKIQIPD